MMHATWRIATWGTILGAFDIKYIHCTSVNGQVLPDLVAKFAKPPLEEVTKARHMDGKLVGMASLHRTLCLGGYMLMVLQIKGDSEWG